MSELALWLERKFRSDFPVELYPNVRVRLWGTPARLEELTRGLAREQLVRRSGNGWSVQEHAGHLLDLEELWTTRLREFLAEAETLTAADVANTKTHRARHNERQLSALLSAFRAIRLEWVTRLIPLAPEEFARTALHPRLRQRMRLVDHLYFIAEHDDHHLARIWELRRQFGA